MNNLLYLLFIFTISMSFNQFGASKIQANSFLIRRESSLTVFKEPFKELKIFIGNAVFNDLKEGFVIVSENT